MGAKDWLRRTPFAAPTRRPTAGRADGQSPLELAGAIGNGAMQLVARSPELRRSPAASLLARSPASLARTRYGDDDDEGIGLGTGTAMDEWLAEQQDWAEQRQKRAEEAEKWIIEHANDWPSDAEDAVPEDEELWRREGARPFFSG
jgi:hypothetical protein